MSDIFISYARSTAEQAQAAAGVLRGLGYSVWWDEDLPAHRNYSDVIEEHLRSAKAVVVIWSAEATKSQWVRAEADMAREAGTLVQISVDGVAPPLPFSQIQCADLTGWTGDQNAHGWRKVADSIADLLGGQAAPPVPPGETPPALPNKPSIAVMPFANLSGDTEQDYFADGMVEEIVTALSRDKSIFVIGSGSTLSFKGKAVSPHEVGRRLGVRYVLEGSVRKAGGRVRIAVRLTDAMDGAQIWGDRFEDTLDDIFALQDKVALNVAGIIEPTVQQAEVRRVSRRPTESMGSYDLYLRALPLYQTFLAAEVFRALELLNRAIALDPDFGSALASAAECHAFIVINGWSDDPESHRRRGIELARRAVSAAGDDAEVLAKAADAMPGLGENLDPAIVLIDRAIALNPGSSFVWSMSGLLRVRLGEPDLAIEHLETAMRLDPLSPTHAVWRSRVAIARFQQRRFVEALALLKETTQQTDFPTGPAYLAATYGHLGQARDAQEALSRYRERSPTPVESRAWGRPEHLTLFLDGIALAEGKRRVGH
ncbi:MAG: TIR domain-containing protein [Caulobacterales bacterium]